MNPFVQPSFSEGQRIQRSLDLLESVATFYQQSLLERTIIYESAHLHFGVRFASSNFAHLCGIKYKGGSSELFSALIAKRVEIERILIKRDGSTFQKLQVLPAVKSLLTSQVAIGGSGNMTQFQYDAMVRSHRKILSIHFQTNQDGLLFPVSLINLRREPRELRGEPVKHITIQHFDGTEQIIF